MTPRISGLWIAALGLLLSLSASARGQSPAPSLAMADTVALSPTGTVKIDNHDGSITVSTWDRAAVGYEMSLQPSDGDSIYVPEYYLDRTKQQITFGPGDSWSIQIPGLLTISTGGTEELTGQYRIVMPKTADLEIVDHASTIEVSNLEADVSIDTHEGKITVSGVTGVPELETFSGTVEATGLRGGADLETHSGDITASFDAFSAASSVDTHSGSIRLLLPAETGFELEGDLKENLMVDEAFGSSSLTEERRRYNGGGPTIDIESTFGKVELRPQKAQGASP